MCHVTEVAPRTKHGELRVRFAQFDLQKWRFDLLAQGINARVVQQYMSTVRIILRAMQTLQDRYALVITQSDVTFATRIRNKTSWNAFRRWVGENYNQVLPQYPDEQEIMQVEGTRLIISDNEFDYIKTICIGASISPTAISQMYWESFNIKLDEITVKERGRMVTIKLDEPTQVAVTELYNFACDALQRDVTASDPIIPDPRTKGCIPTHTFRTQLGSYCSRNAVDLKNRHYQAGVNENG